MAQINLTVSDTINAPADKVYAILTDYHQHHPRILPTAYFTGLDVEEGGQGTGTIFKAGMKVMGQTQHFRMRVEEIEPGRVMTETDLDTGLVTTFTIEPRGASQAEVTFATRFQASPGLKGLIERLTTPMFLRRVYQVELRQLDQYAQTVQEI